MERVIQESRHWWESGMAKFMEWAWERQPDPLWGRR